MVEVIWIVLGAVALVLIVLLVVWLVARSKGKIMIELTRFQFRPGEEIEGTLTLKLNKEVPAKSLGVGLVGLYKSRQYGQNSRGGISRRTQSGVAFQFKQPIDGEKVYSRGEMTYQFRLMIPRDLLYSGNDVMGGVIRSVQIMTGNISSIEWYVEGNLEMKGFNIRKRVRINIA